MLRPSGSAPIAITSAPELVEYGWRDVVTGAVRAIDDDAPAVQVELRRKRALAKLDVAARGVVHAPRLAERRRRART